MTEEGFQTLSHRREEEQYFYQHDLELIERRRRHLDEQRRRRREENERELHWMHCPKCGQLLKEQEKEMVRVDICSGCSGLFIDRGEFELLMQMRQLRKETFLDHFAHFLDRVFTPGFGLLEAPKEGPERR
jgi:Zn-finger nucleic acid-binding protein